MSEVRVLGVLALVVDGEPRPVGGLKAEQILAVMVARRGNPVSVDGLIEALWGESPPKSATATVQSMVSRLRAVLPPSFSIALESAGYRLDIPEGALDAAKFEAALDRARSASAEESAPILEAALAGWQGPAFGPHAGLEKVRGEAVRLDELRLVATDEWAEARLAVGDATSMVGELEALVGLHPLRESYWRLLMLALHRSGRQAEALRRAAEFREMLGSEMGLEPPSAVVELEARIIAGDPDLLLAAKPTKRPADSSRLIPLLLGATSFIGRDPDVLGLAEILPRHPVVTITGPGGVGKTRLALRVAGRVLDDFDDGVTIVELAPLRDASAAAQVIARALDIQQRQSRTIDSTIEEYLASRSCLLVLDNCEHVTDVVAPLVDRLRSTCPGLRVLATSREPLGLAGEYVEIVAPLPVPSAEASTLSEISNAASVELFASRAKSATPGFALTDESAVAVAEICRRLDGLPLAIELAAARLRSMSVEMLAARLDERIALLGQTQRGADGRQRTLHKLVEWSHDLLEPEEQRVFEQLAVFAGGFDLSAAEAVCSSGSAPMSTLSALAGLVEKSMVVFVDPGPPRYRLLEPLREFGRDRLGESDLLQTIEDRHLAWFVEVAARGATGLDGPEEPSWSRALDRDFDNFRAAHQTAIRRGAVTAALQLVVSLREFAFRRVKYEVATWADASTSLPGASDHPEFSAALAVSAYGRFVHGDHDSAIRLAQQSLGEEDEEPSKSGLAERVLGNSLFYMEKIEQAVVWMDRMLESARASGSEARIAHGLYMRSVAATCVGDSVRGAVLAGEAKAVAASAQSPTAAAQAEYALGLAVESSDAQEALRHLARSAELAAGAGNRWIEAFALTEVYSLRARNGESISALAGYADVVETWYRGGDWANQWLSLRRVLAIFIDIGAFEAAAVLHAALTGVGAAHALPYEPADAQQLEQDVDRLRSMLGADAFFEADVLGASMTESEIVGFVQSQIAELTSD